ncbi:MAG: fibronectin type III domain-containing protein [Planctomycetes bacterium]|nr:fibronectin type III domain-containing protein [Planctomycetota bacterium]
MIQLLLAAVLALAPAQEAAPWTPLAGTQPAQVRVVWTTAPSTRATISWSTRAASEVNRAVLVPAGGGDELAFASARDGRYSGSADEGGAWYHHARVHDLAPDTLYEFRVESDGARSRTLRFRTAPADDRAFTLVYGGDSRTVHADRQRMNRFVAQLAAERADLLAFVHGGDYVTDGNEWSQWSLWLSHHELTTAADGRVLPLVPARGNHDGGPLYREIFDDPWGAERDYGATVLAPELALVTLDTNAPTAGAQADWIAATLPALRRAHRWLLVQYHRPMWPALKSPSPAKDLWVPLFEASDVDLVMESDGHVVKRTVPIRADAQDPTGVTYIGEGGLGAPQRTPREGLWYLAPPGYVGTGLHVTLLEVSADALVLRTLGPPAEAGGDALELDTWTLHPRVRVAAAEPAEAR